MKKHSILVLVLLGALSLGCIEEIPEVVVDDNSGSVIPGLTGDPVTLTTTVSLGGGPESKALTAEGVKTFAVGDRLAVIYKNGSDETVKAVSNPLTTENIQNEITLAEFTVTLTDPAPGGALRYIYPAAMAKATIATDATMDDAGTVDFTRLDSQDGTLASLAAGLDLAVYDGSLTASAGLPAYAPLENRLTVGEFCIRNEDGSQDITDAIVHLTITAGTSEYRIHRQAEAGPIYVAMRPVDNANLTFGATDASNGYEKTVTGKTLTAGSMYPIDLKMAKTFDSKATPLTFEAIEAGTVTYTPADASMKVQYSKNGGNWTDYSGAVILSAGDKVAFRGKNDTYRTFSQYSRFVCSADCYLYGNIMSLVTDYTSDADAFASNVTLTADKTFFKMFSYDNSGQHIKSHVSKPIVLPATTLTESCYSSLFSKTGLTNAPVLPAMVLARDCYEYMFDNCTQLTAAPALPATTLAGACYAGMFMGCTQLTTAPELPATTLEGSCYQYMFEDCTQLTAAPALPATTLAYACYYGMFDGCTSLTAAPVLPATVLASSCYREMFSGCSQLNGITCYAVDISADDCTEYWLYGVPASGTFRIHPALNPDDPNPWTSSDNGIPSGWTVESYPVTTKALSQASWEDVGRVIGKNGYIYSSAAQASAAGTTPEAVITYLGTVEGVCSHGLALALKDASSGATFAEATGESLIPGWAASHPVPGGAWRLPSFADWQYLCTGTYTTVNGRPFTGINSLLSKAGGTPMQNDNDYYGINYWSSTSVEGEDNKALMIIISTSPSVIYFLSSQKEIPLFVRACLSF